MKLLGSGILYVFVFLLSAGCFALADYGFKQDSIAKGKRVLRRGLLLLGILIPSLLAGMRANEVGVDVNVYIVPNMADAYYCDSFSTVHKAIDSGSEYLYTFLVYFFSRFTKDAGLLLFSLQFLTITPIVAAVQFMRNKMRINISTSLAMLVYYFCFFNNSLNMMRQSVACAFVILASAHLFGNNCKISKKVLLYYIMAGISHKSALIGIWTSFLLIFVANRKMLTWIKLVVYAAVILLPVMLTGLTDLLLGWGLLPERFVWYANVFVYGTVKMDWYINPFSMTALIDVLFRTVLVFIPYVYSIKLKKGLVSSAERTFVAIRSLVTSGYLVYTSILFSMSTMYGGRLSLYIDMFSILLLPYVVQRSAKKTRNIKCVLLVGIMVLYWVVWIMRLGWSASNFYDFRF